MKEINDKITLDKVQHYLDLTRDARQKATPIHQQDTKEGEVKVTFGEGVLRRGNRGGVGTGGMDYGW